MDYALGEIGLLPEVFWDMTWRDYERAVTAYHTRNARQWEPIRELQTMLYNMFCESGKNLTPQQLLPLFTDPVVATKAPAKLPETPAEFMQRMSASNFFQSPPQDQKNMN